MQKDGDGTYPMMLVSCKNRDPLKWELQVPIFPGKWGLGTHITRVPIFEIWGSHS